MVLIRDPFIIGFSKCLMKFTYFISNCVFSYPISTFFFSLLVFSCFNILSGGWKDRAIATWIYSSFLPRVSNWLFLHRNWCSQPFSATWLSLGNCLFFCSLGFIEDWCLNFSFRANHKNAGWRTTVTSCKLEYQKYFNISLWDPVIWAHV